MRNLDATKEKRPTLRELEVLHAMIQGRKTTSAASMLGISQPAISRAIQSLEERVGKPLFRREGGRLQPTADGVEFYQRSQTVFHALERLGHPSEENLQGQVVRFIAPPTLAHRFLPDMIAAFLVLHPDIRVLVEVGITPDVIGKLADGHYDIGLADRQMTHPGVLFEPFRRSNAHVILPANHALASRKELTTRDFEQQTFIALTKRFPVRSTFDQLFRDDGVVLKTIVEVATSAIAYELVRAGVGISLVNPFPLAFRNDDAIAIRPFAHNVPFETSFVLSTAAPPTRAARLFMDFVRRSQPDDGYSTPLR
ncbi:MAG: LysR family transcriptional regulator [Beijerinckiaceae bacterium]